MKLPRLRLSVRALCGLVLVVGIGLGWMAHRARVQRDAVAGIERSIGRVTYDWQWTPPPPYPSLLSAGRPRATSKEPGPKWAVDALGVDYVSSVKKVIVRRDADAVMAHVGRLGELAELELPAIAPVSDAGLAHVRGLTRLELLRVHSPKITGAALVNVRRLTGLRSLWLVSEDRPSARMEVPLTDADLAHLEHLTALEQLRVRPGYGVTDAGVAHLRGLVRLRLLTLGGPGITSRGLAHLGGLTSLDTLEVVGTRIDDLAPIRHLNGLTFLSLERCPLDDRGLAAIAGFRRLQTLILADTRIGDAGLAHFRGLRLISLELAGTDVTDAGLEHLAGMRTLRFLDLSDTQVTDAGLAYLGGLGQLIEVSLRGTRVTAAGVAALRRDIPGVLVDSFSHLRR